MARIIRRETRQRGVFGYLFLGLFLAFNAFMAVWVGGYLYILGNAPASMNEFERAGAVVGGAMASTMLLMIWLAGAVITGLFALLTRGHKTIVEEVEG
jgi:hypothetical protein